MISTSVLSEAECISTVNDGYSFYEVSGKFMIYSCVPVAICSILCVYLSRLLSYEPSLFVGILKCLVLNTILLNVVCCVLHQWDMFNHHTLCPGFERPNDIIYYTVAYCIFLLFYLILYIVFCILDDVMFGLEKSQDRVTALFHVVFYYMYRIILYLILATTSCMFFPLYRLHDIDHCLCSKFENMDLNLCQDAAKCAFTGIAQGFLFLACVFIVGICCVIICFGSMNCKEDYRICFLCPSCLLVFCCFVVEAMMIWSVWQYRIDAWEDIIKLFQEHKWNYIGIASTDASWVTLIITTAIFVIPELIKIIWRIIKVKRVKDDKNGYESVEIECVRTTDSHQRIVYVINK